MDFYQWLEHGSIAFSYWGNDGTIGVMVNGKKYKYSTDAINITALKKAAKWTPGKAFNMLLQMVKDGHARELATMPPSQGGCPTCYTPSPHYHPGVECPGCGNIT